MRSSERARLRYKLDGLSDQGLNQAENYVISRLHAGSHQPIPWKRRFILALSWLTMIGALAMLLSLQSFELIDILVAIAGGYTLAFNFLLARRYLYRTIST